MPAPAAPRHDLDVAALTVAMSVAPGVYARNRMFAFFSRPLANHARGRAKLVRSLVLQISRAKAGVSGVALTEEDAAWRLSFAIPQMGFTRSARVTREELAALRYVLSRVVPSGLPSVLKAAEDDDAIVVAVLKKLA